MAREETYFSVFVVEAFLRVAGMRLHGGWRRTAAGPVVQLLFNVYIQVVGRGGGYHALTATLRARLGHHRHLRTREAASRELDEPQFNLLLLRRIRNTLISEVHAD